MSVRGGGTARPHVRYLEHLGDRDLALLAEVARLDEPSTTSARHPLRSDPELVERLLGDARTFERLFGGRGATHAPVVASPFLVFAVSLHRAAAELEGTSFVPDWVGPRRRLPVMDADQLRDFVADRLHRFFLAELLASYTRVTSGALWVRSRRGWRQQRFSELDPVRFAALIDVVPEQERPGIYRRLGDLALFLTGVFPDHSSTFLFGRLDVQRLLRAVGSERANEQADEGLGALDLLEDLGRRWYRLACATAPATASLEIVASVAERFRDARRVLNFVTDRHLFRHRSRWFPGLAP